MRYGKNVQGLERPKKIQGRKGWEDQGPDPESAWQFISTRPTTLLLLDIPLGLTILRT